MEEPSINQEVNIRRLLPLPRPQKAPEPFSIDAFETLFQEERDPHVPASVGSHLEANFLQQQEVNLRFCVR